MTGEIAFILPTGESFSYTKAMALAEGIIALDQLAACPFCNEEIHLGFDQMPGEVEAHIHVLCERCLATGPLADTTAEAAILWNARRQSNG